MKNKTNFVTYEDFLSICNVDYPEDFSGFKVKPEGLYVIVPPDDCKLSPSEFAAIYWHPTGYYDQPALALPCTICELRTFVYEAGLLGCISEAWELMTAFEMRAKGMNFYEIGRFLGVSKNKARRMMLWPKGQVMRMLDF